MRLDRVAVSDALLAELHGVLVRPRIARALVPGQAEELLHLLGTSGVRFHPVVPVADCRDAKDDKVLELALASGAHTIVASDADLLVLDPWRGVRILTPRAYLDRVGAA